MNNRLAMWGFFGFVCVQAAGKRKPSIIKYGTLGTADLLLIQVVVGRPRVMSLNRLIKSWTSPWLSRTGGKDRV